MAKIIENIVINSGFRACYIFYFIEKMMKMIQPFNVKLDTIEAHRARNSEQDVKSRSVPMNIDKNIEVSYVKQKKCVKLGGCKRDSPFR